MYKASCLPHIHYKVPILLLHLLCSLVFLRLAYELLPALHKYFPIPFSHPHISTMGHNIRGGRIRKLNKLHVIFIIVSPSEWPRGLRRGSADARLLGLRVRIPPEAWMSVCVSVTCCHVEVRAWGWSLVQTRPTLCVWVCLSVVVNSLQSPDPSSLTAVAPWKIIVIIIIIIFFFVQGIQTHTCSWEKPCP